MFIKDTRWGRKGESERYKDVRFALGPYGNTVGCNRLLAALQVAQRKRVIVDPDGDSALVVDGVDQECVGRGEEAGVKAGDGAAKNPVCEAGHAALERHVAGELGHHLRQAPGIEPVAGYDVTGSAYVGRGEGTRSGAQVDGLTGEPVPQSATEVALTIPKLKAPFRPAHRCGCESHHRPC